MDRRRGKLLTMHGAVHPKADVDRLYIPRREAGRGFLSIESSVQQKVHSLSQYVHESEEKLLKCVLNEGVMKQRDGTTSGKRHYMGSFSDRLKVKELRRLGCGYREVT